MKVIIAAAGTAGHINPGIAIANKIKREEKDSEIIFIGTDRGLENDLVPRAGFNLKHIEAYGLSKKISIDNIKKIFKTYKGFLQAKKIVSDFKPDIVIGTGGYICGAVVWAAKRYKVPVILHESNSFPGKAVKIMGNIADTVLVSFEDAKKRITTCKNVVLTGTPVKIKRQDYSINKKMEIVKEIGLSELKPIVLIFGGSQGAQKINEAIMDIIKSRLNTNYQIIWATGPKQFDIIKEKLKKSNINIDKIDNTKIVPYIYNMEEVENIADVIVARSGAMTITEISNLGKPSILIPLPNVSNDHQMYNAKVLEDVGAAEILLNDTLVGEELDATIKKIVLDKNMLHKMGKNAAKIAIKDVDDKIFEEIKKVVKR